MRFITAKSRHIKYKKKDIDKKTLRWYNFWVKTSASEKICVLDVLVFICLFSKSRGGYCDEWC